MVLILFIVLTLSISIPYAIGQDRVEKRTELVSGEVKPPVEETPKLAYYHSERIIIIGDSRMYGASKVVEDKDIFFIAKNGATCDYLWEIAEPEVDKILKENPGEHFTIFVNLGVNDLDKVEWGHEMDGKHVCDSGVYASYYLKLHEKWKEHNLFFVSVNPTKEEIRKQLHSEDAKMTSNEKIYDFNEEIEKKITSSGIYYCDTYTKLLENGFESPDGLHYSDDTSKEIIELVKRCDQMKKEEKYSLDD